MNDYLIIPLGSEPEPMVHLITNKSWDQVRDMHAKAFVVQVRRVEDSLHPVFEVGDERIAKTWDRD